MTSQWMLWQVNPLWMTEEQYHWEAFKQATHKAFLHTDNIYRSPYVLEYWSEKHGKDLVEVLQNFKDFLGNDIIVGHNVNFDINFIYDNMQENLNEYLSNDFVDTLRISRKVLPNLRHHKLDDLIRYFNLTTRNEHRALNDCSLTNQVYINLAKMLK